MSEYMGAASAVLIVENDEFTRFMMREIVRTLNVDAVVAANGDEALSHLLDRPGAFGLVLMDMHLPEQGGLDTTRQIRTLDSPSPSRIPIIAVTADDTFHDAPLLDLHDLNGFVSKPITPGYLLQVIEEFCR